MDDQPSGAHTDDIEPTPPSEAPAPPAQPIPAPPPAMAVPPPGPMPAAPPPGPMPAATPPGPGATSLPHNVVNDRRAAWIAGWLAKRVYCADQA